jgi:hypothetical protein
VTVFTTKSYSNFDLNSSQNIKTFSNLFNEFNSLNEFNGCGGLVVMIRDCGSLEPGSIPGRGLFQLSDFK